MFAEVMYVKNLLLSLICNVTQFTCFYVLQYMKRIFILSSMLKTALYACLCFNDFNGCYQML